MPCRPRLVLFVLMLVGCTPGVVLEEVDSVIEDALSSTTTTSTALTEEPPATSVDVDDSEDETSSDDENGDSSDGNQDKPNNPPRLGEFADGSRVLVIGDSVLAATAPRYGGQLCEGLTAIGWTVEIDAEKGRFIDFADLVLDSRLLPNQDTDWDVVIIGLGSNLGGSPAEFGQALTSVLERVVPRPVLLITVSEFEPSRQSVNEVIREVAANHDNVFVLEWAQIVQSDAELVNSDGLHLTGSGQARLTAEIVNVIGEAPDLTASGEGRCLDSPFTDDDRYPTGIFATLASLTVKPESDKGITYDRSTWPHWLDVDGSGCDTRDEVLRAEVIGLPQVDIFDPCTIVEADWYSAYDEVIVSGSPAQVHIDHIVALAEAHRSGGATWSTDKKTEFANFRANLVAVSASSNISKSDRDVAEWKPARSAWCSAATQIVEVKSAFGLSVDEDEYQSLELMLESCGEEGQLVLGSSGVKLGDDLPRVDQVDDVGGSSAAAADSSEESVLVNPGNSKNCSDFTTYSEAKQWFDTYFEDFGDVARLDGDGDGEPCESLPGGP